MSRRLVLIPPVLLLVLAGCGGGSPSTAAGSSDVATVATAAPPVAGAAGGPAAGAAAGSAPGAQPGDQAGAQAAAPAGASTGDPASASSNEVRAGTPETLQQRDIVRTATLDVTVPDVDHAADAAVSAAIAAGGRADADDRTTTGSDRHTHLTLRVPAGKLSGLLNTVSHGGHENSRTDHGEDVTAAGADVNARVQQLRISVARLQDFLRRSGSISDLVSLETQLTQRESELESTIGQQRALADQVSLASLTVDFTATLPPVARAHPGPAGFGSAVRSSLAALLTTFRVAAAASGYLLPFAVTLIPVGFASLRLQKRLRRQPRPAPEQA